ncbi:hypothetical protein [Bordetella ansorpii]|uniref:hypothetical protein n=1 Tax=Bordetella ansorpii TaxID=288768 RepID=UPI0012E803AA|nr:hypothetical protein [Bordetella ansorpii]
MSKPRKSAAASTRQIAKTSISPAVRGTYAAPKTLVGSFEATARVSEPPASKAPAKKSASKKIAAKKAPAKKTMAKVAAKKAPAKKSLAASAAGSAQSAKRYALSRQKTLDVLRKAGVLTASGHLTKVFQ